MKAKIQISYGLPKPFEGEPFFYQQGHGNISRITDEEARDYWDAPGTAEWSMSAFSEMAKRVLS